MFRVNELSCSTRKGSAQQLSAFHKSSMEIQGEMDHVHFSRVSELVPTLKRPSSAHGTYGALARPHACQIGVYLRDRGQIIDGQVTTYEAGQRFSELPGDRQGVSAKASETEPAKLLAVFVAETNEAELTIQSNWLA